MIKVVADYELSYALTHREKRWEGLTLKELMSVALCDTVGLYYDREAAIVEARAWLAVKLIELYEAGKIDDND